MGDSGIRTPAGWARLRRKGGPLRGFKGILNSSLNPNMSPASCILHGSRMSPTSEIKGPKSPRVEGKGYRISLRFLLFYILQEPLFSSAARNLSQLSCGKQELARESMAPEPEEDINNEKNPRPLDEDDIALLKTYVRI